MESVTRFFQAPKQSFFLFGPRGTGKSSWIKAQLPDALRLDLLEPESHRAYAAKPERLRDLVEANPRKTTLVIDEVQKVPALLSVVHALSEERKNLRFVLTGSSARKLRREATDLLAGRALLRTMHPFMAAELGRSFRLERALQIGMVPLVVASESPEETLRAYHTLYIKEEIQAEGLVRNVGGFARFLEAISLSHGSMLNLANVSRECEVERKTVEGYLSVLEDLLISVRIPVFTKRAKRTPAVHPKFYMFDAGVFRAARPKGPLDRTEELEGAALEGLVFQHLRAWNAYRGERNTISYWRTRTGLEVDFVLYGPDGFWAVEVKSAKRVHSADVRSLRQFQEDYPEAVPLLLYRGKERITVDGILCLPCQDFLLQLVPTRAGKHLVD
jgi:predicted AAA+ superfamily ATPase